MQLNRSEIVSVKFIAKSAFRDLMRLLYPLNVRTPGYMLGLSVKRMGIDSVFYCGYLNVNARWTHVLMTFSLITLGLAL